MPRKKPTATAPTPTAPEATAPASVQQPAAPAPSAAPAQVPYIVKGGQDTVDIVRQTAVRVLVLFTQGDPLHPDRVKSTGMLGGAFQDIRHIVPIGAVGDIGDTCAAFTVADLVVNANEDIPPDVCHANDSVTSFFVTNPEAAPAVTDPDLTVEAGDDAQLVPARVFTVGATWLGKPEVLATLARSLGATVIDVRKLPTTGPWAVDAVRLALGHPVQAQQAAA
jgi:hypothetical protein